MVTLPFTERPLGGRGLLAIRFCVGQTRCHLSKRRVPSVTTAVVTRQSFAQTEPLFSSFPQALKTKTAPSSSIQKPVSGSGQKSGSQRNEIFVDILERCALVCPLHLFFVPSARRRRRAQCRLVFLSPPPHPPSAYLSLCFPLPPFLSLSLPLSLPLSPLGVFACMYVSAFSCREGVDILP